MCARSATHAGSRSIDNDTLKFYTGPYNNDEEGGPTMAVVRWSPWGQVATLQSDMARLMNQFLAPATAGGNGDTTSWLPPVDVVEAEDALLLHFDLPGLSQDEISVELNDNVLTVSGQRERKHEASKDGYYRFERRFGTFSR